MRVFERKAEGSTWRLSLSENEAAEPICIDGPRKGEIGGCWNLRGVQDSDWGWREVTPTTDVTKLDTAGVFHEVPKVARWRYNVNNPAALLASIKPMEGYVECLRPDIANATIAELRENNKRLIREANEHYLAHRKAAGENAELRARVAELERTCDGYLDLIAKKSYRLEGYKAELRRQMQAAWMRNDLATAAIARQLLMLVKGNKHIPDAMWKRFNDQLEANANG